MRKAGRDEEALEHFAKALQFKHDFDDADNVGVAYAMAGRLQEATNYFTMSLGMKPDYAKAHEDLAQALLSLGDFKGAEIHYAAAFPLTSRLIAFTPFSRSSSLLKKLIEIRTAPSLVLTTMRCFSRSVFMRPSASGARLTQGSVMRHVVVMTATGSIGLMAIFVVDFLNLFYIALLGQQELAAAIGYAGTVLFFTVSLCIGITIAGTALVSRALGARRRDDARRLATSSLIYMTAITIALSIVTLPLTYSDNSARRRPPAEPR